MTASDPRREVSFFAAIEASRPDVRTNSGSPNPDSLSRFATTFYDVWLTQAHVGKHARPKTGRGFQSIGSVQQPHAMWYGMGRLQPRIWHGGRRP